MINAEYYMDISTICDLTAGTNELLFTRIDKIETDQCRSVDFGK